LSFAPADKAALQWYLDHGVDAAVGDEPVDRYAAPVAVAARAQPAEITSEMPQKAPEAVAPKAPQQSAQAAPLLGTSQVRAETVKLAQAASTLEELREAIESFDGISLKKTATNLVFSDGNPKADIMLIGEAPGADEDRAGVPFAGESGHLLDKILACIGLSRGAEDAAQGVYISNILNWRPPGNRTPSPGEIEASLPFIERHIQLAQPKIVIFCGGVAAKSLLGRSDGISRLRKTWHNYKPQTAELQNDATEIAGIATFHPAYLLRTPAQKRAAWHDMVSVDKKRTELGLI